ncbi:hypothetical protein ACLOJK_011834 [Asimina triloba]
MLNMHPEGMRICRSAWRLGMLRMPMLPCKAGNSVGTGEDLVGPARDSRDCWARRENDRCPCISGWKLVEVAWTRNFRLSLIGLPRGERPTIDLGVFSVARKRRQGSWAVVFAPVKSTRTCLRWPAAIASAKR